VGRKLVGLFAVAVAAICLFGTHCRVFAQGDFNPAPDAIYFGGKIVTVDSAFTIQEAFAVKNGKFWAVGTDKEIRVLAGPKTVIVDLQGHTVIPGLIDAHNHQYRAASLLLRGTDVVGVKTLAELLRRIHEAALVAPAGQTVYTTAGWDLQAFPEKRAPTRQELDSVGEGHPVIVQTTRGNAYINTAALQGLKITRDTKTFVGFPVVKDSSGEPTGWLKAPVGPALPQGLQQATSVLIPPPTQEEKEQLIVSMQKQQNALGLTSIRELWITPEVMRAYQALRRENRLTIRVSMGVTAFGSTHPEDLEAMLKTWGVGTNFGDHWLKLDCIGELQVDGSYDNAYVREPFANPPGNYYGALLGTTTPENVKKLIALVKEYDWRPATHIWGDKALDVTLDAYEAADPSHATIRKMRWTVEHALLVHPEQMERLATMGVLVSAQAQPYYLAKEMITSWGEQRASQAEPLRELLDHHLIVGTGSDWPSLPNNPFVNFYFDVTRNTPSGPLGISEKITREEALRMATISNSYITFEEKIKGSIEPNKLADFLILSQDIMTVPDEQIPNIHPLATYVGGERVFPGKD
jgi:predicted amidohydrolase YtcJ